MKRGLKAAIKHQDKIILLVKMMYSGHGQSLPCFKDGEKCIEDLEKRFNPDKNEKNEELNIFTQK